MNTIRNLNNKKQKIPSEPGNYWGKWRIADEGTDDTQDITPSDQWQVMEVFINDYDTKELMVWVPQVSIPQSVENFFWGDKIKPPK